MKIKLDKEAIMPTRAHDTDAGLDLYTPVSFTMQPDSSFTFNTGVHIELPPGTVGMIKSRSGLNVNFSVVTEGVIDEGYTGAIRVKLYNHSHKRIFFDRGRKTAQLVILPCLKPELELVDELEETERGDGGFGSTGR